MRYEISLQLLEIVMVWCVEYEIPSAWFSDIVMRSSVTAFNLWKFTWCQVWNLFCRIFGNCHAIRFPILWSVDIYVVSSVESLLQDIRQLSSDQVSNLSICGNLRGVECQISSAGCLEIFQQSIVKCFDLSKFTRCKMLNLFCGNCHTINCQICWSVENCTWCEVSNRCCRIFGVFQGIKFQILWLCKLTWCQVSNLFCRMLLQKSP